MVDTKGGRWSDMLPFCVAHSPPFVLLIRPPFVLTTGSQIGIVQSIQKGASEQYKRGRVVRYAALLYCSSGPLLYRPRAACCSRRPSKRDQVLDRARLLTFLKRRQLLDKHRRKFETDRLQATRLTDREVAGSNPASGSLSPFRIAHCPL